MEEKEEIIVLDAGSEGPSFIGPEAFCCFLAMNFYRG